jgi:CHAT domain-containing protein
MTLFHTNTGGVRNVRMRTRVLATFASLVVAGIAAICTTGLRAQQAPVVSAFAATPPTTEARTEIEHVQALLKQAWKVDHTRQPEKATAMFEQARIDASRLGAEGELGDALRGLAQVHITQLRDKEARPLLEQALPLLETAGDELTTGRALSQLGPVTWRLGEPALGRAQLMQAREIFERLGQSADLARVYNRLIYLLPYGAEYDAAIDKGLEAARKAGPNGMECSMLQSWGDRLFAFGNYTPAYSRLTEALNCYNALHDEDAARVLVSLGRVHRVHGQYESALELYRKAFAIQDAAHDEPAALQSMNAIAATYERMGRHEDSCAQYQQALTRAESLGSERMTNMLTAGLATCYVALGRQNEGVALLEATVAREKDQYRRRIELRQLAHVLLNVGQPEKALATVNRALDLGVGSGAEDVLPALTLRANIERSLQRFDAAEADLDRAIRMVEEARATAIPQDFMKRGFSEINQDLFAATIALRVHRGDARGALETAEQARSRAFLDLLESRRDTVAAPRLAARAGDRSLAASPEPLTRNRRRTVDNLRGRGADQAAVVSASIPARPALDLASPQTATPPTATEMVATAMRLHSTLLVYWVTETSTFIWVVTPAGELHATSVAVTAGHLQDLTRATTEMLKSGNAAGLSLLSTSQTRPWRELYQTLVKPIREYLPSTSGRLLTVVPHGPLFQVSFAALQDEEGRYLLESYRLHYTPSVGVLAYTAQHQRQEKTLNAKALLVGDPAPPATEPGDDALTPLPWARREVNEIGGVLGSGHASVIIDRDATERNVRRRIEEADILHFATHGVIRQNESMSSFLALAGESGARTGDGSTPPRDALVDGKLTADEVYGLRLRAELVVLSACSTALGPLTGDGVMGFTRAFLYAGAPSVVATEWNVPDQTGYEVMRRFYRFRKTTSDTSEALRSAQLSVLSALRKGTLRVGTPNGTVALRENPLFWAGFVLVGEP